MKGKTYYRSFASMTVWEYFVSCWRLFRDHWLLLSLLAMIGFGIPKGINLMMEDAGILQDVYKGGVSLALIMLAIAIYMPTLITKFFAINIIHKLSSGQPIYVMDSFPLRSFLWYIATSMTYAALVMIGFILFIIPGFIIGYTYYAAPFASATGGLSTTSALSRSSFLTEGKKFDIFLLSLGVPILFLACFLSALLLLASVSAVFGVPWFSHFSVFPPGIELVPDFGESASIQAILMLANLLAELLFLIFQVFLFESLSEGREAETGNTV